MIPGISSAMEARLLQLLDVRLTDTTEETFQDREYSLLSAEEALPLGVQVIGGGDIMVVVTDPYRPLGHIRVQTGGPGSVMFFDNRDWSGGFQASIRILGPDGLLFFNDIGDRFVALNEVFLRSAEQLLYWGNGASAVGLSVELEGSGRSVVVGDDALISAGVWVRNYDMHAMHDLRSGSTADPLTGRYADRTSCLARTGRASAEYGTDRHGRHRRCPVPGQRPRAAARRRCRRAGAGGARGCQLGPRHLWHDTCRTYRHRYAGNTGGLIFWPCAVAACRGGMYW